MQRLPSDPVPGSDPRRVAGVIKTLERREHSDRTRDGGLAYGEKRYTRGYIAPDGGGPDIYYMTRGAAGNELAVGLRVSERQKKERLTLTFVGSSKNATHYGDPADGCLKDETAVQVQGLGGDFCTPPCTGPLKSTCPTDVPKGVTAAPECALQDQGSGQGYCALVCIPGGHSGANQCGKATCKNVQLGIGICTYDD